MPFVIKISHNTPTLVREAGLLEQLELSKENRNVTPRTLGIFNSQSSDASVLLMEHFGNAYPLQIDDGLDEEFMSKFPDLLP